MRGMTDFCLMFSREGTDLWQGRALFYKLKNSKQLFSKSNSLRAKASNKMHARVPGFV
jgi:hypothetical protein